MIILILVIHVILYLRIVILSANNLCNILTGISLEQGEDLINISFSLTSTKSDGPNFSLCRYDRSGCECAHGLVRNCLVWKQHPFFYLYITVELDTTYLIHSNPVHVSYSVPSHFELLSFLPRHHHNDLLLSAPALRAIAIPPASASASASTYKMLGQMLKSFCNFCCF